MKRFLFTLLFLLPLCSAFADSLRVKKVYRFSIREEIAPPVVRVTSKALDEAHRVNADLIFIDLNTYGGMVDAADSIRTRILRSRIPVIVLIENNAASAGALISIACDSIYMNAGSTIGAATVVDQSGQQVPDKYQSYMRKKMRATAEMNGRDPDIAEAMVDPDVSIPGIIDSGKVLTFTTEEALIYGFCDGEAASFSEVMDLMGVEHFEEIHYQPTWIDKIIHVLINPFLSGILIMIMIGGIYFEMQTPGIGFPLIAAITAAVLYFAPHYLEGLAAHWEILLFVIGLGLLMVEIFVIPGFGVAGISGIVLMVGSLTLSLVGNVGFDFPVGSAGKVLESLLLVIVSALLAVTISLFAGFRFIQSGAFRRLVLAEELQGNSREVRVASASTVREGLALTDLRPSGRIEIEGEEFEAVAQSGYIPAGEAIVVVRGELNGFIVKRKV